MSQLRWQRGWPAGRRWSRHMAYNHVRRICTAAKVPTLPPQVLRRTQAALATDAGATGLMVAQHLGHATGAAPAVTHRSYVERDAARDAAVQRGLRVCRAAGSDRRPTPGAWKQPWKQFPALGRRRWLSSRASGGTRTPTRLSTGT